MVKFSIKGAMNPYASEMRRRLVQFKSASLVIAILVGFFCHYIPSPACEETAKRVMTPKLILPGTESRSIQKLTQDMATMRMEGK